MFVPRKGMSLDYFALAIPAKKVHDEELLGEHIIRTKHFSKYHSDQRHCGRQSVLQPGDLVGVRLQNRRLKLEPVLSETLFDGASSFCHHS